MTAPLQTPPSAALATTEQVRASYAAGRYHEALRAGASLGDLRAWPGAEGRVLAARLAARLGAPRLSQALVFHVYRAHRTHAVCAFYYGSLVYTRRGPWHALRWLRRARTVLGEQTADLMGLEARSFAALRDFERAHATIDVALQREPDSAWLHVERSFIFELEDRVDAALASAADALALTPAHRPALHRRAHLLSELGQREEAYACLSSDVADQSWELLSHRAELAFALGRYDACGADLERARRAASLAEPGVVRGLAARQAEAAYLVRRHRRAEAFAREATDDIGRAFAVALTSLEDGSPPPRVELTAVPHIRQHHVTCAPASLASVTAYHGDAADHLEIAAAICYGGTPIHRQRTWAEDRGYVVRELDVTLAATRALIDAGLPFLLSTAGPTSAHAQVVIGYDLARRSLLIRDPSAVELVEMPFDTLFEGQAWHGPHGLVLAPEARVDVLSALDLPAAELLDRHHALSLALDRHDVEAARRAADAIALAAPGSRHAWNAKLEIACYEGRTDQQLACYDALLALHPNTAAWVLRRGEAMRGLVSRAEQLAFWRRHAHLGHPPLLEALAEELRMEHERRDEAARLLRRALRLQPTSGMAHHVLADLEASRGGDPEDTLESYRFGALLGAYNPHFARAYFEHARLLGRDEEALTLLERRVEEASDQSVEPARTLVEVYADHGNPERGRALLEALARARPEDGDVCLLLVHACLDVGDAEAAEAWMARAAPLPARQDERVLAEVDLARTQGRLRHAMELLERAHRAAPERVDRLVRFAHLQAEVEGDEAALASLEAAHAARPDDSAVLGELCVWLRGKDDERALTLLQAQLARHPEDAWAQRELPLVLMRLGRLDEAVETARSVTERLPYDAIAHSILGSILVRRGALEEARASLRRAVELDVDAADAIRDLARTGPERCLEDARFVLDRLEERVSRGAGLLEAAALARVLPHDERTARMERLLERSPHRPDAWEATIGARLHAGELDAADELARKALRRFPRWSTLRMLRADVLRAKGQLEATETVLRELVEQTPRWAEPRIALSHLLRERGALEEAGEVIEDGLRRAPRNVPLRIERARLAWALGREDDAFDGLLDTVRDAFSSDECFNQLCVWARALDREDQVEAMVRARIAEFPDDPRGHVRLAISLTAPERLDEHLEALHRALALHPRHEAAADILAESLARAGRFDEALDACPPPGWVGPVSMPLRGRRAWILAQRGDREAAAEEMARVLDDAPSYDWGRRQLCDWLEGLSRFDAFLEQAEKLVSEAPTVGGHYLFLGDARQHTGDLAGAREAFARAVELAPAEIYAASRLTELQLGAGDVDAARETLQRVRHAIPPAELASITVRVEAAAGQSDAALAALDRMLSHPASQRCIEQALAALAAGPAARAAFARVEDELAKDAPPAGVSLAHAWSNVRPDAGGGFRILKRRAALGTVGRLAVALWIEALAARRAWLRLGWVWLRHRRWLREGTETWASFGLALHDAGWTRACVRWLADWRERPGVRPWMLLNLLVALWIVKRARDAEAVLEGALALPADHTAQGYRVWTAFHHALRGDIASASAAAELARGGGGPVTEGLLALVDAFAAAESVAPHASSREWLAAVSPHLERAAQRAASATVLRAPYDHAVAVLTRRFSRVRRTWIRFMRVPHYYR